MANKTSKPQKQKFTDQDIDDVIRELWINHQVNHEHDCRTAVTEFLKKHNLYKKV